MKNKLKFIKRYKFKKQIKHNQIFLLNKGQSYKVFQKVMKLVMCFKMNVKLMEKLEDKMKYYKDLK